VLPGADRRRQRRPGAERTVPRTLHPRPRRQQCRRQRAPRRRLRAAVTFMRNYLARMKTAPYEAPAPPAETPVVLGSLHPKMIALAASETAGVLTYLTSPEKTAQIRAAIGPRKWLCAAQPVLLERNPGRARAAARAYM